MVLVDLRSLPRVKQKNKDATTDGTVYYNGCRNYSCRVFKVYGTSEKTDFEV